MIELHQPSILSQEQSLHDCGVNPTLSTDSHGKRRSRLWFLRANKTIDRRSSISIHREAVLRLVGVVYNFNAL